MDTNLINFDEIKIGDVVVIIDTYNPRVAVGVVKEKRETEEEKGINVQYGFNSDDLKYYVVEYKVKPKYEQTFFVVKNLGNVL